MSSVTPIPSTTDVAGVCPMEQQEFYKGLAQRVRDLSERADPFTRRRLQKLADQYHAKGRSDARPAKAAERPLPVTPTTPPATIVSVPGEV